MIEIRLRDLENVSSDEVDVLKIMKEVVGYKDNLYNRLFKLKGIQREVFNLVEEARSLDPNEIEYADCWVKLPNDIDDITFVAMLELTATLGGSVDDVDVSEMVADVITMACYSENRKGDYENGSKKHEKFRDMILDSSLSKMFGLFNEIVRRINASGEKWGDRFESVEVFDPDYQLAGGERMQQFNVIATLESLCDKFNVGYKEAWQISYKLSQTLGYKYASAGFTQEQMTSIKEAKMIASRKQ